jgi:hypothetical protein
LIYTTVEAPKEGPAAVIERQNKANNRLLKSANALLDEYMYKRIRKKRQIIDNKKKTQ